MTGNISNLWTDHCKFKRFFKYSGSWE